VEDFPWVEAVCLGYQPSGRAQTVNAKWGEIKAKKRGAGDDASAMMSCPAYDPSFSINSAESAWVGSLCMLRRSLTRAEVRVNDASDPDHAIPLIIVPIGLDLPYLKLYFL